ncbi:DNA methyltransferase [Dermabacteraceae bacterium P13088]
MHETASREQRIDLFFERRHEYFLCENKTLRDAAGSFWRELLDLLLEAYVINLDNYCGASKSSSRYSYINIPESKVLIATYHFFPGEHRIPRGTLLERTLRSADVEKISPAPKKIIICDFDSFTVYSRAEGGKFVKEVGFLLSEVLKNPHLLEILEFPSYSFNSDSDLWDGLDQEKRDNDGHAATLFYIFFTYLSNECGELESEEHREARDVLCLRLLFMLFADSLGLSRGTSFVEYLRMFSEDEMGQALSDLFKIVATPAEERGPHIGEELRCFPYIDDPLFSGDIALPRFTPALRDTMLQLGCVDWFSVSPVLFGYFLEAVLSGKFRVRGEEIFSLPKWGEVMEDIHWLIGPLFLDEFSFELNEILINSSLEPYWREKLLSGLHQRLASFKLADPYCLSGAFLAESFLCLRRLENKLMHSHARVSGFGDRVESHVSKVKLGNFLGKAPTSTSRHIARLILWAAQQKVDSSYEDIWSNARLPFPAVIRSDASIELRGTDFIYEFEEEPGYCVLKPVMVKPGTREQLAKVRIREVAEHSKR